MSQLNGAETRSFSSEGIADGEFEITNPLKVGPEVTVGGDCAVEVKRKRGRPPRGQAKAPPVKKQKEDEDVCFICFDGGSLVLCDRRSCPKAYHPACIKRDDSFFRSNIKWNCGWHICSVCQKAAHYMCYTCTYSLCKGCTKDADYLCVRGDKGFCTTCMRTIMLIEKREEGNNDMAGVDFDDKSSWEYLFKVYWLYLKEKLSLNLADLSQAKNPWKESGTMIRRGQVRGVHDGINNIKSSNLDRSCGQQALNSSLEKKPNKLLNLHKEDTKSIDKAFNDNFKSLTEPTYWATKELLDFIAHMKNGDTSVLSQFDVQELLLDYINRNNLRDPRLKSHILCDSRLKTLFGKPRVGHFEMLKLIEFHFFTKEEAPKDVFIQGGVVDTDAVEELAEENIKILGVVKKQKTRKKGEECAPRPNLNEYAAVDVHNINMIYLRRNLMENLIKDKEQFHNKVVGSVVRIRISGGEQKNDLYRLVQVVGTIKVSVPYKTSSKTADAMLEVLNLDKKEVVSIDAISNQDFSEDECRRLRQSIKCGLVKRFNVGEIQEKALELQSMRFSEWLETETLRLTHLRDRASENGRYKELRECVEKLKLLKTPEEHQRRLRETCDVHIDPNMHPDYESEEEAEQLDSQKQVQYIKPRYSGKREDKPFSPSKEGDIDNAGNKACNILTPPSEQRNMYVSSCPNKEESAAEALQRLKEGRDARKVNSWERSRTEVVSLVQGIGGLPFSVGEAPSAYTSETKLWHYIDPNGKTQGPFCMSQLQKWSTTGYFPPDMKIWAGDEQDNSILLTDALKGLFHKVAPLLNGKQQQVQSSPLSTTVVGRGNGTHAGGEIFHKIKGYKSDPNYEIQSQSGTTVGKISVGHILDDHSNTQFISGQSSGNNLKISLPEFPSNALQLSSVPSLTNLIVAPEQNGKLNVTSLQSPSQHNGENIKTKEVSFFPELPSPTPKTGIECQNELDDRTRQSVTVNLPCQDIGPKWNNTSSIVLGELQLADISGDWGGYSPTPAEHSVNKWHSSLISLPSIKPTEGLSDRFSTAASTSGELAHSSASHLSSWQTAICEPIEFSTLAEESVSDLLAEVDAMESRRGLTSPTSVVNCG